MPALAALQDSKCDCGKPAKTLCGTGGDYPTVQHCLKPVCRENGHWCLSHRHREGTMTYGLINTEFRFEFERFVPDSSEILDVLHAFVLNCMPLSWKLKYILHKSIDIHPPPAPLPKLAVHYLGRRFVQDGDRMVEDKNWHALANDCPGQFGTSPGPCSRCGAPFQKHNDDALAEMPEWAKN